MKLKFLKEDWLDSDEYSHLDKKIKNPRLMTNPSQEFSSKDTSLRQVPGLHKHLAKKNAWKENTINLDYGGGRFDDATDFVSGLNLGVKNLVYDAFNRDERHNQRVENMLIANGGADTVTCANVLNVIKEPEVRNTVIDNIYYFLKDGGTAYFTVYKKDGEEGATQKNKSYQMAKDTKFYIPEIESVFGKGNVSVKNSVIRAEKK